MSDSSTSAERVVAAVPDNAPAADATQDPPKPPPTVSGEHSIPTVKAEVMLAVPPPASPVPLPSPDAPRRLDSERRVLYVAASVMAVAFALLFVFGHYLPESQLARSMADVFKEHHDEVSAPCYYQFIGNANVFRGYVGLRFVIIVVGALCSLLGAMFVIKGFETSYEIGLESKDTKATLRTASPGLVMFTVGAALCFASLMRETHVDFAPAAQCMVGPKQSQTVTPTGGTNAEPHVEFP